MSKNDPPRMITFFDSDTHFEVDIDPAYDIMIPKICPHCLEERNEIYYMYQEDNGSVSCDYHEVRYSLKQWKERIRQVKYDELKLHREGGDNMAWGKFWMVIGRNAQTTSCRHDSKEEAKEEAERLARKEESAFAVLECVEICEPEQAPLTWSEPKEK